MDPAQVQLSEHHRHDVQLQAKVRTALRCPPGGPPLPVHAEVRDGVVLLSGRVDSRSDHARAATVAAAVAGVRGVRNDITVTPAHTPGSELRDAVREALQHRGLPASIDVAIEGATVVLKGWAPEWAERQAAVEAARSVPGVRDVNDAGLQVNVY